MHTVQDLAGEIRLKGKLSLRREWSGWSVLTNGKRPKNHIDARSGKVPANPYISLQIFKFLKRCTLLNIGSINTKLKICKAQYTLSDYVDCPLFGVP